MARVVWSVASVMYRYSYRYFHAALCITLLHSPINKLYLHLTMLYPENGHPGPRPPSVSLVFSIAPTCLCLPPFLALWPYQTTPGFMTLRSPRSLSRAQRGCGAPGSRHPRPRAQRGGGAPRTAGTPQRERPVNFIQYKYPTPNYTVLYCCTILYCTILYTILYFTIAAAGAGRCKNLLVMRY